MNSHQENAKLDFNEEQIHNLFGHEAAENETSDQLRRYYFKTNTYSQVIADLPLRILVGHKGIGKSALFQTAIAEEEDAGKLTVLIKPDDIVGLGNNPSDFLQTIREWKAGLLDIIASKIFSKFGADYESKLAQWTSSGGRFLEFIFKTLNQQKFVNLNPANKLALRKHLDSNSIYVYIDDLDRGWKGGADDIRRLSALLSAVRDLSTDNQGVYFRISLRSDVYFLVRTSDESTDKIEGSVIWQTWTNHEIFILWVKRIESFFGRDIDEAKMLQTSQAQLEHYLRPIMEPRFHGRGHWANVPMYRVVMSLIRRRPRDLVKLCTLAAKQAQKHSGPLITTKDLEDSFVEYSQGRLQDTINEYRSELGYIEHLLMGMRPSKREKTTKEGYVYKTDSLIRKINNIREQRQFKMAGGRVATSRDLAAFMYKINFLTARKSEIGGGQIVRKYFEESRYIASEFADFGFDWEVHPAYRWALQPDDIDGIFQRLELSSDEA